MAHDPVVLPPSFWRLSISRAFSTFATQMLSVITGWLVYAHSHSALALGLVGLTEAIPALGLALWAGAVVDRGNVQAIYRRVLWSYVAITFALLLVFAAGDWVSDTVRLVALYVPSALFGISRAFVQPCLYTLTPRLVPATSLPKAAAWSSSVQQLARVLGPGLGGLFYGWCGVVPALVAASLILVASVSVLRRLVLLPVTETDLATPPTTREGKALWQGLRYVWAHPILLSALSLDMVCVLFGGVTAVLPVFAEQILACGPQALGWLRAAPAMGSTVGALVLTRVDIRRHAGAALLCSVAAFGCCSLAFALSRSLSLSLALLFVSGAMDSVSVLVRQLILQLMSPANMRGRISAVNSMFIGSSNELGEFESGVMAWWLGLVLSVLLGGTLCLLFVALTAVIAPSLRRLDLHSKARATATPK